MHSGTNTLNVGIVFYSLLILQLTFLAIMYTVTFKEIKDKFACQSTPSSQGISEVAGLCGGVVLLQREADSICQTVDSVRERNIM